MSNSRAKQAKRRPPRRQAGSHCPCELSEADRRHRLADKILDAFTHACSFGENEIARELMAMLGRIEADGGGLAPPPGRRLAGEQAELWIEFVAARDAYVALAEGGQAQGPELAGAVDRVKACYRRWIGR